MTNIIDGPIAKWVLGQADSGRLVLTRADGSTERAPVLLIRGSLVDNGDGSFDITGLT